MGVCNVILYIWKLSESGFFDEVAVIDDASSVIWVERHTDTGEFEVYIRASKERLELFADGDVFITRSESDIAMYAESVKLNTDEENGDYLTVSGRSAEVMLHWRIVQFASFTGETANAENIIRYLFTQQFLIPADETKYISWLSLEESHEWEDGAAHQYTGKSLNQIFGSLCVEVGYGYRLRWIGTGFQFELYKGTDRSYDQHVNPFVVFSPTFENLGNTEYEKNTSEYANAAIVGGEGEGATRTFVEVAEQGKSGFYFRQVYLDARNSSKEDLTDEEYEEQLTNDGKAQLEELKVTAEYSGEILNYNSYEYRKDYNLGDKVSIKNQYGITGNATITEITEVEDASGYRIVPTLSEWQPISFN